MTPLDQIRAKVEEVRKHHAAPNESGAKLADLCVGCDTLWPCDALRWAEAALRLAEAHYATCNIEDHEPEYCYGHQNYSGWSFCGPCRAEKVLADIAEA